MSNPNIRDRELIERLVRQTGKSPTEIARIAGIAASTLTRVAHGKTEHRLSQPTIEKLQASFPALFGDISDIPDDPQSSYVEVETLPSYAGMGGGGYGEGEPGRALVARQLVFERLRATPRDLLLIDVRGESMSPDFVHGDQLLVDRRDKDPSQPGPFALWDGDTYVVKLVERIPLRRGWFRVFSANDRYSAYEVGEDDIRILGRPVWLGRAL
jgi:phage repressor protein C with HTH and peptisase S24 domain